MWILKKLQANRGLEMNARVMFYFIGLRPARLKTSSLDPYLRSNALFVLSFTSLLSLLFLICALTNLHNTDVLVECTFLVLVHTMLLIKVGYFFVHPASVQQLAESMEALCQNDDWQETDDGRTEIIAETQWRTNFVVFGVYLGVAMHVAAVFARLPALVADRRFFTSIWLPGSAGSSPIYELFMVLWTSQVLAAYSAMLAVDAFLVAALLQLTGQFRLVRHDVEHVRVVATGRLLARREQEKSGRSDLTRPADVMLDAVELVGEMDRRLQECVHRHQETIRLTRELEAIFQPILLNQLIFNVVPTVLGVLFVATMSTINDKVAGASVLLVAGTLELLVFCILADQLSDESELVRDAVFGCDWFDQSESFKRSMRIIMSRSNRPEVIKVGAFVVLSRETFLGIMHVVYSYLNLALETKAHGRSS